MQKISYYLKKLSNASNQDIKESNKNEQFIAILLALLSATIYGFMPMMARTFKAEGGDPILLAIFRFFFSSLFLLPLIKASGNNLKLEKYTFIRLFFVAIFYAITPAILYLSYEFLDTGIATILHFSYPAFVILLCLILYKDKPNLSAILCLIFSIIGICLIQTDPSKASNLSNHAVSSGLNLHRVIGIIIAVVSGLTYALYVVLYSKSKLITLPLFTLAFYLNFLSFCMLLPYKLLTSPQISISIKGILVGILLAFSCSILATIFFQYACSKIGGQKAALLSTFEPLVSVIAAGIFLGEKLSLYAISGVFFILLASFLLIFEKKQKNEKVQRNRN